jgi:hypothetical protein
MSKFSVVIETVDCTDTKAIKQVQQKLNVWKTTGILVKYEIHTTATHIVFNICKIKD